MYRKKGRGWTKHIDFMLIDIACIVIAFFISYVIRFGFNNPYVDKDYRILGGSISSDRFLCGDNGRLIQECPKERISG